MDQGYIYTHPLESQVGSNTVTACHSRLTIQFGSNILSCTIFWPNFWPDTLWHFPMPSDVFWSFHSYYRHPSDIFTPFIYSIHLSNALIMYCRHTPMFLLLPMHLWCTSDIFHSSDISDYVIPDLVTDTYHVAETRIVAALLWLTHKLRPASNFNC